MKKYKLFFTLLIAFVSFCRILFTSLPSYKIDMNTWQAWAIRLVDVGPFHFYAPGYFADYFPGYLYILLFLGKSFLLLFPHISIVSLEFETYLKLFTNIFDFLTAFYIYKIVSKHNQNWGAFAVLLYLSNPGLLFNSSIMGQVDGILTFFLVWSLYYLLETKETLKWSFASALAFVVKPQGAAILPISIIYLFRNVTKHKVSSLLLIPLLMIIFSLPFFLSDPIFGLLHLLPKSASTYPYTSMFSYNFWSFAGFWKSDSQVFLGLTYQIWGTILFLINLAIIGTPLLVKKIHDNTIYYFAMALSAMAFFLFLTRIHQRYIFPVFALVLIVAAIKKSWKILTIYFILSLVHFTNLWFVYFYYNYVYNDPNFGNFPIFSLVNNHPLVFSSINLILYIYLVIKYYMLAKENKAYV